MERCKEDKNENGWVEQFDEDDLCAQPGQVAKVSSVDSVKCVIVHHQERLKETQGCFWL